MDYIEVPVPDGKSGDWYIDTFTVSEKDAAFTRLRETVTGGREKAIPAGTYKRLVHRWDTVMSNTPMEVHTHLVFIERASGDVLINGLGLGMALKAILEKPEVRSVTVIEKSPDVIALVAPTFAADRRVEIINGDAFTWQPPAGQRYDVAWHDIWTHITAGNLREMDALVERYAEIADWQGCWAKAECVRMIRPARGRAAAMSM